MYMYTWLSIGMMNINDFVLWRQLTSRMCSGGLKGVGGATRASARSVFGCLANSDAMSRVMKVDSS